MGERLVAVGPVELCIETFGDPAGPTVLLVSGASASMDWWDTALCRRIAEGGRHVVRYDHRDTGRSTTATPGRPSYDGWQLGRDCAGLVEALGRGPVHLVGLSMGGGIGQTLALQQPQLLASLTLVATAAAGGVDWSTLPGPSPEVNTSFASPPPEPDWADVDSYVDWVVRTQAPFAGDLPVDERELRSIAATAHARSLDPAAAGNHWLVVGGDSPDDVPLDIHEIRTPTLVIHGSADPMFPLPHGRALADAIPGATLLVVPGMGHEVPPPATWDLVVPALLRHTRAVTRPGRPG